VKKALDYPMWILFMLGGSANSCRPRLYWWTEQDCAIHRLFRASQNKNVLPWVAHLDG